MRVTTPYPPQAALQGHGGLETWPACGGEPARQKFHADDTESDLDIGYTYLRADEGWLYPGYRARPV